MNDRLLYGMVSLVILGLSIDFLIETAEYMFSWIFVLTAWISFSFLIGNIFGMKFSSLDRGKNK